MKVKNGTASSVSFDMIAHMRCGSAWNSVVCSRPSSIPPSPKKMPIAARAKATG